MQKTLRHRIELYNKEMGYGTNPVFHKINVKYPWCCVEHVAASTNFRGMAAGVALSLQVQMWTKEYGGQQYVLTQGVEYKVISATGTGEDSYIKLLLARGDG